MQLKSGTIVQGGLIVPTKEKLIRKLFQSRLPRNFTKQDLDALLSQCGCVKGSHSIHKKGTLREQDYHAKRSK